MLTLATKKDFDSVYAVLKESLPPIPLRLMTTDGTLSFKELDEIKTVLYQRVYGQK